ncbi:MAG: acetyltransferase [Nitritalea sp.]
MKKKLFIVGSGSVGLHIASNPLLYGLQENYALYLVDDDPRKADMVVNGIPVVGDVGYLEGLEEEVAIVIGIAFPKIKRKIFERFAAYQNFSFPSLVARNAWLSPDVQIGKGSIIYPHCSLNYGSRLGDFVLLNMNCAVGHHGTLEDFVTLAPGVNLGGHTHLKQGCDMGIGSATLQGVSLAEDTVVGGQAMVVQSSMTPGLTLKGVPAR